jgi:hypothetical protein
LYGELPKNISVSVLGATTLTAAEETQLQEMLAEEGLLRAITGNGPISAGSIESLFAYTKQNRPSAKPRAEHFAQTTS